MKRNIVWTLFVIAMLLVSLTTVAKEKQDREKDACTCSLDMIAGAWGYTETGMQVFFDPNEHFPFPSFANSTATPLELRPYASVGSYTIDAQGVVLGQRTNAQSTANHQTCIFSGTATVNPDCTGLYSVSFHNPEGQDNKCEGSSVTKLVVYVNNATEASMIIPVDLIPIKDNLKASGVLTTEAKKLFPNNNNPGLHLGNCGR
jgi:hypothetical protein